MVKTLMPNDLEEALHFMAKEKPLIINGGTDLMVQRRTASEMPLNLEEATLYLKHLNELDYIKKADQSVHIGATCVYETMLYHQAIPKLFKACLHLFASPGIRNIGTLAGNIGNASPAADGVLMLVLYNAKITLKSKKETRIIPIQSLITGVKETTRNPDELITDIEIETPPFTHTYFKKIGGRKSDAISKVSFAGGATLKNQRIKDIRLAFGAVNVTVVRDRAFEKTLMGQSVQQLQQNIEAIKTHYATLIRPIDDQRSTARYRKKVALNLCEAFIASLLEETDG